MTTYPYEAKRRLDALTKSLTTLIKRDPEQEVQGIAVPVLVASLNSIKEAVPGDPVVEALVDLVSGEQFGSGGPIRAADMLVVTQQLDASIGPYPVVIG